MPITPESIDVGRCYLTRNGLVAQVVNVLSIGRVVYTFRKSTEADAHVWTGAETDQRTFALLAEHEVPCDWTPEGDG